MLIPRRGRVVQVDGRAESDCRELDLVGTIKNDVVCGAVLELGGIYFLDWVITLPDTVDHYITGTEPVSGAKVDGVVDIVYSRARVEYHQPVKTMYCTVGGSRNIYNSAEY